MMQRLASFAKELVKSLLFRPWGVSMGERSVFRRPWTLANRSAITIGARTRIGSGATMHPLASYRGQPLAGRIDIGSDVYIGGRFYVFACGTIEIGDGCVLSEDVYVTDNSHGLDPRAGLIMDQPLTSRGPVRIGRHVFIGYGASILDGVTLGDHCVVGTRSVVTRSFPAYSMVAGVPARLIKTFDPQSGAWVTPAPSQEAP
jgi:acetyltransferase-like isoleucine patch superfamily enzyme